jgi:FtsH-binding integral membrane protein
MLSSSFVVVEDCVVTHSLVVVVLACRAVTGHSFLKVRDDICQETGRFLGAPYTLSMYLRQSFQLLIFVKETTFIAVVATQILFYLVAIPVRNSRGQAWRAGVPIVSEEGKVR